MSNDDVSYLVENDEVWRCDPCAQTRRKSMVLESKTSVSYDDVLKLVTEIKDDFKRVETSLGGSLNACHEEIAQIKDLVNKQREELTAWAKIAEDLRSENASLRRQVSSLEARMDEAEQYSRRNTLEIHGIPVEKGENVVSLVKMVGRALDYPVEDGMIDACHRLRTRDGSGKPPGIVVKMVRRLDAEGLLQKRRVKRNLNTHDLGHTSRPADVVYVNESLAPGRRKLLNAARQVKKDKAYTYLWIRGGKILMRKNAGDRVKVVTTMDDLTNL
ncbi:uncharacterized protein LOC124358401 [Homalodisca vitripennis]|uniref:uncharacterized protein LOC124358401 n=1 Tax=Homalodisca vitripennis TaxID=197043 RepID=UPI001EEB5C8E|nr:uncharacterized protein LOC124358401 [Homalodisca vitripennis]